MRITARKRSSAVANLPRNSNVHCLFNRKLITSATAYPAPLAAESPHAKKPFANHMTNSPVTVLTNPTATKRIEVPFRTNAAQPSLTVNSLHDCASFACRQRLHSESARMPILCFEICMRHTESPPMHLWAVRSITGFTFELLHRLKLQGQRKGRQLADGKHLKKDDQTSSRNVAIHSLIWRALWT